MEIIGKLKENVEKAENKEEAKEMIKEASVEAGMELNDEEVDELAGGRLSMVPQSSKTPPLYWKLKR